MFAIASNALYTSLRRRGTTRQLAGAIVTCVISALLLLPAIIWYNLRFAVEQAAISVAEVEVALVYVALFGWFLPLSVTVTYCLFSLPRVSTTSIQVQVPHQRRTTRSDAVKALNLLRRQPGEDAPYVFGEDNPWGWLEHRGGRFQGQRLALKRAVVTIGRGEDNDIWLDDDIASRHHAELIWDQGQVYITDCDSLNGVLLNGRRIRNVALVEPGGLLEIGSHRLLFEKSEQPGPPNEQDDPLLHHVWQSSTTLPTDSDGLPNTWRPPGSPLHITNTIVENSNGDPGDRQDNSQTPAPVETKMTAIESQDTAQLSPLSFSPQPVDGNAVFTIHNGERAGQSFALDRPILTIGRGTECDVVINDTSISRCHAQVLRQAHGCYVQDLSSRNGTKVNDEPLNAPHLLQSGDIVCLGSINLAYTFECSSVQVEPSTPMSKSFTPPPLGRSMSSPARLSLPSKPKNQ